MTGSRCKSRSVGDQFECVSYRITSPMVSSLIAVLLFKGFFASALARTSDTTEMTPLVIAFFHMQTKM